MELQKGLILKAPNKQAGQSSMLEVKEASYTWRNAMKAAIIYFWNVEPTQSLHTLVKLFFYIYGGCNIW